MLRCELTLGLGQVRSGQVSGRGMVTAAAAGQGSLARPVSRVLLGVVFMVGDEVDNGCFVRLEAPVTETVYRHVVVPAVRGGATVMDEIFGTENAAPGD